MRHGGRQAYDYARIALQLDPDLDTLGPLLDQARMGVLISLPGDVATVSRGMHELAGFLDPMNGLVNRLLEGAAPAQ